MSLPVRKHSKEERPDQNADKKHRLRKVDQILPGAHKVKLSSKVGKRQLSILLFDEIK